MSFHDDVDPNAEDDPDEGFDGQNPEDGDRQNPEDGDRQNPEDGDGQNPEDGEGVSERRLIANRENAKRSTGPRTPQGKAQSSQNATKSGVFAVRAEPLRSGPFAEDPAEYAAQLDALIESYAPRDAREFAMATRLATLNIAFDRLERWYAALVAGASRMRTNDYEAGVGSEQERELKDQKARALVGYLMGVVADEDADFAWFATLVRSYGPRPGVSVKDLWTETRKPQTPEEWKRAFDVLKDGLWSDPVMAQAWAHELSVRFARELGAVYGLEEEIAAGRIMDGPLDLQLKYHARIRRELTELEKAYAKLQKRRLPRREKTNPTDPEAA